MQRALNLKYKFKENIYINKKSDNTLNKKSNSLRSLQSLQLK